MEPTPVPKDHTCHRKAEERDEEMWEAGATRLVDIVNSKVRNQDSYRQIKSRSRSCKEPKLNWFTEFCLECLTSICQTFCNIC
jgi:hypothetical protein